MSAADSRRLPELELLRALAAQLIVWHHLAYYGPMSDAAHALAPRLFDWLAQHGRLAVQVFLVLAGFLAARALVPAGRPSSQPLLGLLERRAWRLLPPYWIALGGAVAAAVLARRLMDHEVTPAAADPESLLAHVLLLHSLLGIDSLSAGVWYVAIDFQLFALLALLGWLCRRSAPRLRCPPDALLALAVMLLAGASMWHFNRDAGWDAWGLYFFGSYALGIAAAWLPAGGTARRAAWGLYLLAVTALAVDFRVRLALALATSLLVVGLTHWRLPRWPKAWECVVDLLARTSYATFLLHFPLMLVVAALLQQVAPHSALANLLGMWLTWAASLVLAAQIHRRIEQPVNHWLAQGGTLTAQRQ